jgi:cyclopropane fatty-acyl-phospholipid synthase-like methyltransferase
LAVSDFATPALWRQDLDERWPERMVMKGFLKRFLVQHCSEKTNPGILELGIGDGELLLALVDLLPEAQLVAMDINQTLLDHCSERVATGRFLPVCNDLTHSWSGGYENTFDAVYSLQSIHDFGGREALKSTYTEIASALKPGGALINADFVVPLPQDKLAIPRRFPVEEHLQILNECGFQQTTVLHTEGLLGCLTANKPN